VPGTRTGAADGARFLARRWGLASARRVPVHALWVALGRPWRLRRLARSVRRRQIAAAAASRPRYVPGTELWFDGAGADAAFLGVGWWYPESHGVWSRGHVASLLLPLDALPADSMELQLMVHVPVTPRHPEVVVRVVVNDLPVGRACLKGPLGHAKTLVLPVPAHAVAGWGAAEIVLVVERSAAPLDTRLSTDLRQIGVGLIALCLGPVGCPRLTQRPAAIAEPVAASQAS
jgi:hypothetical protein